MSTQNAHSQMSATDNSRSMTVELLVLAAPIILMTVSRMLMGFVDVYMVAKISTEALAAISPAAMFVFVLACVGLGVVNSVQTFVSQADGRGEPEQAGAYAWQTFYIAGLFALLTWPAAATTEIWFGWLARLGEHTPAVTALEIQYIRIAIWSVPPSIVCIGLNGFFMGLQKPWVTFIAVTASLVANVFGNWVLIFGHLGFPALGIEGAAYATVAAWIVRAAVLTIAMLLPAFSRRYNTLTSTAFSWEKTRGLIRIGIPVAFQWLFDIGSWAAFMALIMPKFGEIAMAASNVGMQLMHLSFMPAIGIGLALCSQVGFVIGEGEPQRAYRRAWVAFRLTAAYMVFIGLLFWAVPDALLKVFTQDPAVIAMGRRVLFWAAIFQLFDAAAITFVNALRGAGDTRWPAIVTAVLCWTIFIGCGWASAEWLPDWGINGPWAMCTLYIIVVGVALLVRWYSGAWEHIRLFDDEHPAPQAVEAPDEAPMAAGTAGVEYVVEADETAPQAARTAATSD